MIADRRKKLKKIEKNHLKAPKIYKMHKKQQK